MEKYEKTEEGMQELVNTLPPSCSSRGLYRTETEITTQYYACSNCNGNVYSSDTYCVHCGKEFVEKIPNKTVTAMEYICNFCDSQVGENDNFCSDCGCKLQGDVRDYNIIPSILWGSDTGKVDYG